MKDFIHQHFSLTVCSVTEETHGQAIAIHATFIATVAEPTFVLFPTTYLVKCAFNAVKGREMFAVSEGGDL